MLLKNTNQKLKLISDNDIETFLDSLEFWRDKLIFKLLYLSSANINEILDLKIEDIPVSVCNSSSLVFVLEDIKSKDIKRNLYIPTELAIELDNYILEERCNIDTENSYLFVSMKRDNLGAQLTYNEIYRRFKNNNNKTKIKLNFKDLRYTFLHSLVENGLDISTIHAIMGYNNICSTTNFLKYMMVNSEY